MPPVKFDRIVSCSSEDPAYPAKNLLLGRDKNRKWKCKSPGEESASVIIQLDQQYVISAIDIGNESSSFVEVLVSRTSTPDDFKVLLAMSSFMTPMDARSETNGNRVRMFSLQNLSESVRTEKWDRIKVVCRQQFSRHLQYGLSFIVVHTTESKKEVPNRPASPVKVLGRFALKDEDDSAISVGSFFTRRKDLMESPLPSAPASSLTGAAAVRDASSPANLADQKHVRKRKGSADLTDSQKKKRGKPKESSSSRKEVLDSPSSLKPKKTSPDKTEDKNMKLNSPKEKFDKVKMKTDREQSKHSKLEDKASLPTTSQANSLSNQSISKRQPSIKENVTYKPFNKLMEGVEIVISGYVNPGRANIREKALQMGAKYKPDWFSSSTHLICAFANTPKFQQVKGKGIIVSRDWVDDCFQERKKLSWRRYAVDSDDRKDASTSSEPEVWELIPGMNASSDSLPPVSRRNNVAAQDTRLGSESSDSEDEIQRIKAKQTLKKKKLEKQTDEGADDRTSKQNGKDKDVQHGNRDSYCSSTDIDSEGEAKSRLEDWSEKQKHERSRDSLPPLPDFLQGKTFLLSEDLTETEVQSLTRYVTAFGGSILKFEDKSINYVIAHKQIKLPEGARSVCVTPDWLWECNDCQRLISPSLYEPR